MPNPEWDNYKPDGPNGFTIRELQEQQRAWVAHNFGGRRPTFPALGAGEEMGELADSLPDDSPHVVWLMRALGRLQHGVLKQEQGIRGDKRAAIADAMADIVIFLADLASSMDLDLDEIVRATWGEVRRRDWIKYPETGLPPGEGTQ